MRLGVPRQGIAGLALSICVGLFPTPSANACMNDMVRTERTLDRIYGIIRRVERAIVRERNRQALSLLRRLDRGDANLILTARLRDDSARSEVLSPWSDPPDSEGRTPRADDGIWDISSSHQRELLDRIDLLRSIAIIRHRGRVNNDFAPARVSRERAVAQIEAAIMRLRRFGESPIAQGFVGEGLAALGRRFEALVKLRRLAREDLIVNAVTWRTFGNLSTDSEERALAEESCRARMPRNLRNRCRLEPIRSTEE